MRTYKQGGPVLSTSNAETATIPRLRTAYESNPLMVIPETQELNSGPNYQLAIVILLVCLLMATVASSVISFWNADQTSQMNQLQQCMMRVNPDPNTNYQLETYKCMNGK
jgi:hypothetical protein